MIQRIETQRRAAFSSDRHSLSSGLVSLRSKQMDILRFPLREWKGILYIGEGFRQLSKCRTLSGLELPTMQHDLIEFRCGTGWPWQSVMVRSIHLRRDVFLQGEALSPWNSLLVRHSWSIATWPCRMRRHPRQCWTAADPALLDSSKQPMIADWTVSNGRGPNQKLSPDQRQRERFIDTFKRCSSTLTKVGLKTRIFRQVRYRWTKYCVSR